MQQLFWCLFQWRLMVGMGGIGSWKKMVCACSNVQVPSICCEQGGPTPLLLKQTMLPNGFTMSAPVNRAKQCFRFFLETGWTCIYTKGNHIQQYFGHCGGWQWWLAPGKWMMMLMMFQILHTTCLKTHYNEKCFWNGILKWSLHQFWIPLKLRLQRSPSPIQRRMEMPSAILMVRYTIFPGFHRETCWVSPVLLVPVGRLCNPWVQILLSDWLHGP